MNYDKDEPSACNHILVFFKSPRYQKAHYKVCVGPGQSHKIIVLQPLFCFTKIGF